MDRRYSYNDVLIKPQFSTIRSRSEVSLASTIGYIGADTPIDLTIPIISANMDTITGADMVIAMHKLGGFGILHRFMSIDDMINEINKIQNAGLKSYHYAVSIGVGEGGRKRWDAICELLSPGAPFIVCIDVAHGHSIQMKEMLEYINTYQFRADYCIIAGNVATFKGAFDLLCWGADVIKVGVGPGSLCTTRINTGIGVPQLSAIQVARNALVEHRSRYRHHGGSIIADGGIKNGGDAVKALAAGADTIMLGSMLAGCDETPGQIIEQEIETRCGCGKDHTAKYIKQYKKYRGMASFDAQVDWKHTSLESAHIEGESTLVERKGPVSRVIKPLCNNIKSGMSYSDARTIKELQHNCIHRFIAVTPLGYGENKPHLLG